ncbi:MAG TPA: site-specific integrase [Thermoanaerobaculia bacterium]|nr:site-specific integrase [Thermoanaerobaculia bacterium]
MKLTKTVADGATYQGNGQSRCVLWDDSLPAFGLRVYPSGKKAFVVFYRAGRQQRLMVLGSYGKLTVQTARQKAQKVLASVLDGADPVETRQQERTAPMMAELADRYLREHARPKKKAASIKADERLLRLYVLPALGRRTVESLTIADAAKLHHSLHQKPIQANRVLALLSKLMSLAERWGMRAPNSNPCRTVERFRENKCERFLSSTELARLGEVLAEAERDASEHLSALLALRLLLLTGARKNEILALRWEEVDFERSCLRLRDSKTGQKVIPLGAATLELLETAPREEGNPYVCFGEKAGQHFIGLQRPWQRLRKKAGLPAVRLHDLRHTHASVGAGAGFGLPIIGRILGHTNPSTTARYSHLADDPLQQAANHIAGEIAAHLARRPVAEAAEPQSLSN